MEPRDRLRLELGDTNVANPLFSDAELDQLLAEVDGAILLAAANACDILATRYAGDFDFGTREDKRFSRSQKSKMYAARADRLRQRFEITVAGSGVGTIDVERADGWTERHDHGVEHCDFPAGEVVT